MQRMPNAESFVFHAPPPKERFWLTTTKNEIINCVVEDTVLSQVDPNSPINSLFGNIGNDRARGYAIKNNVIFVWDNHEANLKKKQCTLQKMTSGKGTIYKLENGLLRIRDAVHQVDFIIKNETVDPKCGEPALFHRVEAGFKDVFVAYDLAKKSLKTRVKREEDEGIDMSIFAHAKELRKQMRTTAQLEMITKSATTSTTEKSSTVVEVTTTAPKVDTTTLTERVTVTSMFTSTTPIRTTETSAVTSSTPTTVKSTTRRSTTTSVADPETEQVPQVEAQEIRELYVENTPGFDWYPVTVAPQQARTPRRGIGWSRLDYQRWLGEEPVTVEPMPPLDFDARRRMERPTWNGGTKRLSDEELMHNARKLQQEAKNNRDDEIRQQEDSRQALYQEVYARRPNLNRPGYDWVWDGQVWYEEQVTPVSEPFKQVKPPYRGRINPSDRGISNFELVAKQNTWSPSWTSQTTPLALPRMLTTTTASPMSEVANGQSMEGEQGKEFNIAHQQFLSDEVITRLNAINREVHHVECNVKQNRLALLTMMEKHSPVRAAKLLGFGNCQAIKTFGAEIILSQCQEFNITVGAKKTSCGFEPYVFDGSLSTDGMTVVRPFTPCLHDGHHAPIGDALMEYNNVSNDWVRVTETIQIQDEHLESIYKIQVDRSAVQTMLAFHKPVEKSMVDRFGELSALMEERGFEGVADVLTDVHSETNLPNTKVISDYLTSWRTGFISTLTSMGVIMALFVVIKCKLWRLCKRRRRFDANGVAYRRTRQRNGAYVDTPIEETVTIFPASQRQALAVEASKNNIRHIELLVDENR